MCFVLCFSEAGNAIHGGCCAAAVLIALVIVGSALDKTARDCIAFSLLFASTLSVLSLLCMATPGSVFDATIVRVMT